MKKNLLWAGVGAVLLLTTAAVSTTISSFKSVSVTQTNFVSEEIVTNGLTLGSVRKTAWPAGGFAGAVSNNVASAGLLAVDTTKTNGIAATAAHVNAALGYTPANKAGDAFIGAISAPTVTAGSFQSFQGILTHAGTVTLDFGATNTVNQIATTGNLATASSNLNTNRTYMLRVRNTQATNCNVVLPSSWRFMSGTVTNILASGKIGNMAAFAWANSDTNVDCWYWSE